MMSQTNNQEPSPSPFAIGTVVQNDDPEYPARVKVHYTVWNTEKEETKWIPLLAPYAGKEYGSYCVPEVDDIVLVAFLDCRQDKPFVMGSFFPVDDEIRDKKFTEENWYQYYKTKGEIEFTLYNEPGKQCITAETPGELFYEMDDDEETITLDDTENHIITNAKEKTIVITGSEKITLQTTEGSCQIIMDGPADKITIKAKYIEIEGTQDVEIEAGDTMDIEAGDDMSIEAGNNIDMEAGTVCSISGGPLVKIN